MIVPGGVDPERFAGARERAAEPTLLCASSLADPRKRGPLLIEAFTRLRARLPEARLVLAGGDDMPAYGADRLELPAGVERMPASTTGELADAYAGAWASVVPSVEEAFGLVVLESLAAGTPVVGARSGAIPSCSRRRSTGSPSSPTTRPRSPRPWSGPWSSASRTAPSRPPRPRGASSPGRGSPPRSRGSTSGS